MSHQQLSLDFETPRVEAFALAMGACAACGCDEKIESLVRYVFNLSWGAGPVTLTLAELGAVWNRHRATARRWVDKGVRLGLLTCEERRYQRGGQRTHALAIDWDSVRRLALDPERTGAAPAAPPAERGSRMHHRGSKARRRGSNLLPPIKEDQSCLQSSPSVAPPAPQGEGGGWEEFARRLEGLGLARASQALAAARSGGADLAAVAAVLAHWEGRPGAWGLGALYVRLGKTRPGSDPAADWPPASEAWLRAEARRRRDAADAAAARQRAEREATLAAERRRDAELEAAHGPAVDALTDAELHALLGRNPLIERLEPRVLRGAFWRGAAIAELARRAAAQV